MIELKVESTRKCASVGKCPTPLIGKDIPRTSRECHHLIHLHPKHFMQLLPGADTGFETPPVIGIFIT